VAWHEEPFDPQLVAAVREILAPLIDQQWAFDVPVDRGGAT
jgi:hypothetical protein